ncbi:tRNA (5-methylaminomethyl-2-thiouridine)(34)-methyltransferase MnmD [Polaribacter batillariae]|uniref:tRNA (5-methylaminomethyl-2-thiouridine)(34)-methyltransferase MnmD n=1 Tax=Polaribacter batillariae TaxID=2808900 RepID=A0ABX7SZF9_9FLAO|nr:tRNA (5-methylaminomethyl-2-thiouridine)(34)-methyltransferase MnmD [Polaribacter batillariae]QTD38888.1 tRNA (5-methylaminomethyl-2-thiouridine)(34)-methyltransferase MnmD [Polaribacter batillariae]
MKREIRITSDGSTTIHLPDWNEQYHSKNGSINETYHVFIENGLRQISADKVAILEIGFGTGLNAFITYLEAKKPVDYVGVEAYPVISEEIKKMNFITVLDAKEENAIFNKMHEVPWEEKHQLTSNFSILKRKQFFEDISDKDAFHLIYFDAFGARVQPQLWTEDIFAKMFTALKENGILVTYSAKGSVRRAMQAVGFTVERLPGPPGKREMLRAVKK